MKRLLLIFTLLCFSLQFAQTQLVFVFFKDKPNKAVFYANPLIELSQKALTRRTNLGIALNDQDAPIEATYIQNIQNLGFVVTDSSKWLNGVAVNASLAQISTLLSQSYVQNVESFVKNPTVPKMVPQKNKYPEFEKNTLTNYNYGNSTAQIDQLNLRNLHIAGYTGLGINIAVIDTGFPTVDTGSAFAKIRNNGQIIDGYNFISKNTDIYNTSLNTHGAVVLGTIGGFIDNTFVGSAPEANFYLYCTENAAVEIPEEELYWIEAAEEADRKGVDVITSSLGYSIFNDSRYNYTYAQMTGQKSFVARGAQIASEKGIIVLIANGNEGNSTWHYLLTPADNQQVFSIGSVDSNGAISSFSSFGPNANGVIKPDACARGTNTATVYNNGATAASGTSLATPVAAGGVACLLQAIPNTFSRDEVKNRLRQTASLYPISDNQKGWGILNFGAALQNVLSLNENSYDPQLTIFPNPTKDKVYLKTFEKVEKVEIFDHIGRLISEKTITHSSINIGELATGIYYLKIKTGKNSYVEKIIKQ